MAINPLHFWPGLNSLNKRAPVETKGNNDHIMTAMPASTFCHHHCSLVSMGPSNTGFLHLTHPIFDKIRIAKRLFYFLK